MQFTYKATNKEGKTVSGNVEAADRQAVLAMLHIQSLHPVLIEMS
jgi:type II secretory pathway component PulF